MLYTLSQAQYNLDELTRLIEQTTAEDAIVLWQNGVLQAIKFPYLFAHLPNVFALENDVKARGLNLNINTISLSQLVEISEKFHPQIAL